MRTITAIILAIGSLIAGIAVGAFLVARHLEKQGEKVAEIVANIKVPGVKRVRKKSTDTPSEEPDPKRWRTAKEGDLSYDYQNKGEYTFVRIAGKIDKILSTDVKTFIQQYSLGN